jgi:hypothetical protein
MYGYKGHDSVSGEAGADRIYGDGGTDKLNGDNGADQLAEEWPSHLVGPTPVKKPGFFGYRPISAFPKAAFNRAPTPSQRMRVLKWDKCRCRICGRKAADHVGVELHVPYVKPGGKGGLTVDGNLAPYAILVTEDSNVVTTATVETQILHRASRHGLPEASASPDK